MLCGASGLRKLLTARSSRLSGAGWVGDDPNRFLAVIGGCI